MPVGSFSIHVRIRWFRYRMVKHKSELIRSFPSVGQNSKKEKMSCVLLIPSLFWRGWLIIPTFRNVIIDESQYRQPHSISLWPGVFGLGHSVGGEAVPPSSPIIWQDQHMCHKTQVRPVTWSTEHFPVLIGKNSDGHRLLCQKQTRRQDISSPTSVKAEITGNHQVDHFMNSLLTGLADG